MAAPNFHPRDRPIAAIRTLRAGGFLLGEHVARWVHATRRWVPDMPAGQGKRRQIALQPST